eukprot:7382054-Prymnesium_polylepis.1
MHHAQTRYRSYTTHQPAPPQAKRSSILRYAIKPYGFSNIVHYVPVMAEACVARSGLLGTLRDSALHAAACAVPRGDWGGAMQAVSQPWQTCARPRSSFCRGAQVT